MMGGGIGDIIAREVHRGWYIARKDDYYDSMNVSDYLLCGWGGGTGSDAYIKG